MSEAGKPTPSLTPATLSDVTRRKAWLHEALAHHVSSPAQRSALSGGTPPDSARPLLADWKWKRWYCQQDVSCGRCDTTEEVECFLLHGMLLE